MKQIMFVILAILLALSASTARVSASEQAPAALELAPGVLIVRFTSQTPGPRILQILDAKQLAIERYVAGLDAYVVSTLPGSEHSVLQSLQRLDEVRYAEQDGIAQGLFTPVDADYANPRVVYAPQLVHAETGWDFTRGSPEIIVGVVDSGLVLDHPEFAGRIVPCTGGCDFVNGDEIPADDLGHGTHVAGIIAAAIDGQGMVGIAPNVRILPVKVLNASNNGTWSNIASGIVYAVDHGAQIINLSLGGTTCSQLLWDAVQYAFGKGVLLVAAAGNSGSDVPMYPAYWNETLSVSATNEHDEWWTLSDYSAATDVSAPGSTIWSTYLGGSGYQYMTGTSMAAAHVSGQAALILSANPALSAADVRALIQDSAIDLGGPGLDPYFGWGRVDVGEALRATVTPEQLPRGSVGDFVWIQSASGGEPSPGGSSGLSGVPVTIAGYDIYGAPVDRMVFTTAGQYLAENLLPGEYTVTVPALFVSYALDGLPSRAVTLTIESPVDLSLDFAYVQATGVLIQEAEAKATPSRVTLSWSVLTTAGPGFRIWRSQNADLSDSTALGQALLPAVAPDTYTFVDTTVTPGTVYYYTIEYLGDGELYGPLVVSVAQPLKVWLPFATSR